MQFVWFTRVRRTFQLLFCSHRPGGISVSISCFLFLCRAIYDFGKLLNRIFSPNFDLRCIAVIEKLIFHNLWTYEFRRLPVLLSPALKTNKQTYAPIYMYGSFTGYGKVMLYAQNIFISPQILLLQNNIRSIWHDPDIWTNAKSSCLGVWHPMQIRYLCPIESI